MSKPALTAEDWIKAGMRALAAKGATALKAEALARKLGATKGSFYWHFKDVPDFERHIIATWQQAGTAEIVDRLAASGLAGPAKLRQLFEVIGETNAKNPYGGVRIEPSIRDWAKSNAMVRRAVSQTGTQRIAYVAGLLRDCGKSDSEAQRMARLLYAALIGFQALAVHSETDVGAEMQALLDLMLR